jgi:hypothetical protein
MILGPRGSITRPISLHWVLFIRINNWTEPVTVTARSKAWTVFAFSDVGIVGSNPTQGVDVWCVYTFILCLCCPVFRYRPYDELITRPRSPTVCEKLVRNWIRDQDPKWVSRAVVKNWTELNWTELNECKLLHEICILIFCILLCLIVSGTGAIMGWLYFINDWNMYTI